jgi:hypothetical protein
VEIRVKKRRFSRGRGATGAVISKSTKSSLKIHSQLPPLINWRAYRARCAKFKILTCALRSKANIKFSSLCCGLQARPRPFHIYATGAPVITRTFSGSCLTDYTAIADAIGYFVITVILGAPSHPCNNVNRWKSNEPGGLLRGIVCPRYTTFR